jgi:hypothetical protein
VSNEHNLNLDDLLENEPVDAPFSGSADSMEYQLQIRANELIIQRTTQLRSDIERLQSTINEITERLIEGTRAVPTRQETSGLLDYVRSWFDDSTARAEEDFRARLEEARSEASAETRAAAEAEFQDLLKKAAQDWDNAQRQANEIEVQKRVEQARDEAVAAIRVEMEKEYEQRLNQAVLDGNEGERVVDEAEFQQRLVQACADAAAVARRESESQLDELREQLEASRKALTLAVSTSNSSSEDSAGLDLLKTAVDDIDRQRSQSETLATLVQRASDFTPRLVFFVIRGGDAIGWKAKGFENGLNDDTVRKLTVPTQKPGLLHDALSNFTKAEAKSSSPGDQSSVLGSYGTPAPQLAIAVPLVVRGKAAAVIYADSGTHEESSLNSLAIETLMRVAGMAVELLPARRGAEPARPAAAATTSFAAPSPAPSPAPSKAAQTAPIGTPAPASSPAQASPATVAPVASSTTSVTATVTPQESSAQKPAAPVESAKTLEKEIEQMKKVSQTVESPQFAKPDWAARVRTTEELIKPRQIPESWPDPEDQRRVGGAPEASSFNNTPNRLDSGAGRTSMSTKPEDSKSKTTEEPVGASAFAQASVQEAAAPPRSTQPPVFSSVPTPASETEQRAHNDARRFARLLVSEIKLYNAAKVNEGRRNFDLYDRLREEIDRSRKVYDKRVMPSVASRFDYFYDELVQTLAEGDPAKLGPNSPGPVVLTA